MSRHITKSRPTFKRPKPIKAVYPADVMRLSWILSVLLFGHLGLRNKDQQKTIRLVEQQLSAALARFAAAGRGANRQRVATVRALKAASRQHEHFRSLVTSLYSELELEDLTGRGA